MNDTFEIEKQSGRVTLPNGLIFDGSLTQAEFESWAVHDPGRASGLGADYFYHRFVAGRVDGHPLDVSLGFHRNLLFSFSFSVDFYPPGAGTAENLSDEIEHQKQMVHAKLMRKWLGRPHRVLAVGPLRWKRRKLGQSIQYEFVWGTGWCAYDERSRSANSGIRYLRRDS